MNKETDVTTAEGRGYEGKIVRLDTDSLWLQSKSGSAPLAFRLDQVFSIRPSRHVWAPVYGFVGGMVVGGVIGGSVGASQPVEEPDPWKLGLNSTVESLGNGVCGMIIGAGVGGVIGGVALGLLTSVTDYRILCSPPRKEVTRLDPMVFGSVTRSK